MSTRYEYLIINKKHVVGIERSIRVTVKGLGKRALVTLGASLLILGAVVLTVANVVSGMDTAHTVAAIVAFVCGIVVLYARRKPTMETRYLVTVAMLEDLEPYVLVFEDPVIAGGVYEELCFQYEGSREHLEYDASSLSQG